MFVRMVSEKFIKNLSFSLYIFFYVSLIVGFFLNENTSGGAIYDFNINIKAIESFSIDLIETYKSYDSFSISHFPYYYIFLSVLLNISGSVTFIKLAILHLSLYLPFIFYQILKFRFPTNRNYLIFIPGLLFLSPYFRSTAIWALNDNIALIFFSLSILYFLKALYSKKEKKRFKYVIFNLIFIVFATYIRQYYAVFGLYFFFNFLLNFSLRIISLYIFFGLILISPILYQILNPNLSYALNFLSQNLINNFILLLTIFIIYLIPFYLDPKNIKKFFLFYKKNIFLCLIIFLITLLLIYFFDYHSTYVDEKKIGGGIFYKILFKKHIYYLFYTVVFISILLITHFSYKNFKHNIPIIIFFFLMFPVGYVFQKYLDPLSLIIIFGLLKSDILKEYQENIKFRIKNLYIYFLIIYLGSILNYYIV